MIVAILNILNITIMFLSYSVVFRFALHMYMYIAGP